MFPLQHDTKINDKKLKYNSHTIFDTLLRVAQERDGDADVVVGDNNRE